MATNLRRFAPNYPLRLVAIGVIGAPVGLFGPQYVSFFLDLHLNGTTIQCITLGWLACFIFFAVNVAVGKTPGARGIAIGACFLSLLSAIATAILSAYILVEGPQVRGREIIALVDALVAAILSMSTSSRLRDSDYWTAYSGK
jgi:hypothetical protein